MALPTTATLTANVCLCGRDTRFEWMYAILDTNTKSKTNTKTKTKTKTNTFREHRQRASLEPCWFSMSRAKQGSKSTFTICKAEPELRLRLVGHQMAIVGGFKAGKRPCRARKLVHEKPICYHGSAPQLMVETIQQITLTI